MAYHYGSSLALLFALLYSQVRLRCLRPTITRNVHLIGPFSTPLFHTPLFGTVKHYQAVGHYQALSGTVGLSGCRAVGRVLDSLTVLDRTQAWSLSSFCGEVLSGHVGHVG